ncbi:unnamed protein product [Leuciscus chuanchicus]
MKGEREAGSEGSLVTYWSESNDHTSQWRAMTTAACALTGGFITASDRASSKTPSEEYTLCVGQNKHPASSGGTINYLYHRQNSRDALNIATCSSGRVKDDLCLMATLNFTAIGPCAFWGLGRHKMVVINCCSCSLETRNEVEAAQRTPLSFVYFCTTCLGSSPAAPGDKWGWLRSGRLVSGISAVTEEPSSLQGGEDRPSTATSGERGPQGACRRNGPP